MFFDLLFYLYCLHEYSGRGHYLLEEDIIKEFSHRLKMCELVIFAQLHHAHGHGMRFENYYYRDNNKNMLEFLCNDQKHTSIFETISTAI